MLTPPFKLASKAPDSPISHTVSKACAPVACCDDDTCDATEAAHVAESAEPARRRIRLADMDQFLHCSVLGTCLGTAELRKLMARFIDVKAATDVEVHHEAVWLSGQNGAATKALQKALDQRHAAALQRFGAARDQAALKALWIEALAQGEIPGAYWAVLTHRDLTPDLRKKVFGDVHMLSHLVGAANRADIRKLVALERENAELRERLDKQQQRILEVVAERNAMADQVQALSAADAGQAASPTPPTRAQGLADADAVALQTQRREQAEQAAAAAARDAEQLRAEFEHLGRHTDDIARELAAAEMQLREAAAERSADGAQAASAPGLLDQRLRDRRIFYVGGRPSSTPVIRDVVLRHGGEIKRHDGGLEDRKGLLAAGVGWASLVVFPVDCIDHDSALNLKRVCLRLGVPFLPLRTASAASFVSALASEADQSRGEGAAASVSDADARCLRHS